MALLDRIRKHVRVTARRVADAEGRNPGVDGYVETWGSPFDEELSMLVEAARRDLVRIGIRKGLVYGYVDVLVDDSEGKSPGDEGYEQTTSRVPQEIGADVEQCITLYVKQHFGYDNDEAPRFGESYRMAVIELRSAYGNLEAYTEPEEATSSPSGSTS